MSADALKKKNKSGKLGGAYLFYGDEEYLKDHYLGQLRRAVETSPLPEFNHIVFEEKDMRFSDLGDALETLPTMANFKLIEIREPNFEKMKADTAERYAALLDDLPDYAAIVFLLRGETDGRLFAPGGKTPAAVVAAAVRRNGLVVEFKKETESKLYAWIDRHFTHRGVTIGKDAVELLVAMCGNDMYILAGEIEKLASYASDRPLTAEDVRTVCCANSSYRIFDMSASVTAGDYRKARTILADLMFSRTPPELIIATLGKSFCDMLLVRDAQSAGKSPAAMAGALKLQDWQLRRVLTAASRAEASFLAYAVRACAETDLRLKSVACEPYAAIETLLVRLRVYGRARKTV